MRRSITMNALAGRSATVIIAVLVALSVTIVGLSAALYFELRDHAGGPRSENPQFAVQTIVPNGTALTFFENGIMWTNCNSSEPRFLLQWKWLSVHIWDTDVQHSSYWWGGRLDRDESFPDSNLTLCINHTDLNGNGIFDYGDFFIVFAPEGYSFPPWNDKYIIELDWTNGMLFFPWVFSFELQNDEFIVHDLTDYDLEPV